MRWQLAHAAIGSVCALAECTMCRRDEGGRFAFHSERRDRATRTPMAGVQWPVIAIAGAAS